MALTLARMQSLSEALRRPQEDRANKPASNASTRRSYGMVFTPIPLVQFVTQLAFELWRPGHRHTESHSSFGETAPLVLDPAAGDGRFLAAIVNQCPGAKLCAIEYNPVLARGLRRHWPQADVFTGDALLRSPVADGSCDIVVGNPPYVRSLRFAPEQRKLRGDLQGKFAATEFGEWDLYAPFIEKTLHWIKPTGVGVLIVPSRWWTSQNARALRSLLSAGAHVRALVDFGYDQVFANATTYTSVLVLQKCATDRVDVARKRSQWSLGAIPACSLGANAWDLSVGRGRSLCRAIERNALCLSDVARVAKGTGTNADRVFLLAPDVEVEEELVVPAWRGRDIPSAPQSPVPVRCLLPYDRSGQLFAPEEIRQRFPKGYNYLLEHRARLEAREGGRFSGPRFYCFGRPQNLVWLLDRKPKLVIPDITQGCRAAIDDRGTLVLDSAYAVRPTRTEVSVDALWAVFASRAVTLWLGERGVFVRGGYTRLKTATLRNLPVPRMSPALDNAISLLRASAALEDFDDAMREAYEIESDLWYGET